MLKTKKHLMLLALLFIPVLGFSQESKNKPEENNDTPSMIAIRDEDDIIMEPGVTLFGAKGKQIGTYIGSEIGEIVGEAIGDKVNQPKTGKVIGKVVGGYAGGYIGDKVEDIIKEPHPLPGECDLPGPFSQSCPGRYSGGN